MKKINLVIPIVVVIVLAIFYLLINLDEESKNTSIDNNFESITSEGEVVIDLKPLGVRDSKYSFEINVNTHTVSLEQYDLMKLITLEFDSNKLNPSSAPKLNGHHNSGILAFDINKDIKVFKVVIKDIPDIKGRVFEWK